MKNVELRMKNLIIIISLVSAFSLSAQETKWAYQTFRDTRVINGHSVETGTPGEMKLIISHRFGNVSSGPYEMFGLDNSTIRYGLDFAVKNGVDIGIGRSSYQKTVDMYYKKKLFYQKEGAENFPFTIVYLTTMSINGQKWSNPDIENYFSSRLTYTHQLLIGRKFNHRFSLQFMPTFLHRNLVNRSFEKNDLFGMGIAGRYQWTKVTAVQFEYVYIPESRLDDGTYTSLSIGFEFQTKNHVFQVNFSNSMGMVEPIYLAQTRGQWTNAQVGLGFNLTRDFKIRGRKF